MNRTVLVNGGSRGIGRAVCKMFAENGARVAFTYLKSEAQAMALAEEIGALAIRADSRKSEEVGRAVQFAEEKYGFIDTLVNCAAKSEIRLFTDIDDRSWQDMMAVNLNGYFYYARAVLPAMIREKKGKIINISSMWGQVGASCEVHYSASKAAIIGLTKALAKEVAPSGITVNCVSPGVIMTEMNQCLSEEDRQALIEETPLGRLGEVSDIARAVLFLAGEGGDFMTGQNIAPNGGFVI